jgi:hypothetical protein
MELGTIEQKLGRGISAGGIGGTFQGSIGLQELGIAAGLIRGCGLQDQDLAQGDECGDEVSFEFDGAGCLVLGLAEPTLGGGAGAAGVPLFEAMEVECEACLVMECEGSF